MAEARPVKPTGFEVPQPVTPGSPTPVIGANGDVTVPKAVGRFGATRQANDGGIRTPRLAVTVTVSGCAVGEATNRADAWPFRNVLLWPGICAVGTWQGTFGVICGRMFGLVVMLMAPGM